MNQNMISVNQESPWIRISSLSYLASRIDNTLFEMRLKLPVTPDDETIFVVKDKNEIEFIRAVIAYLGWSDSITHVNGEKCYGVHDAIKQTENAIAEYKEAIQMNDLPSWTKKIRQTA